MPPHYYISYHLKLTLCLQHSQSLYVLKYVCRILFLFYTSQTLLVKFHFFDVFCYLFCIKWIFGTNWKIIWRGEWRHDPPLQIHFQERVGASPGPKIVFVGVGNGPTNPYKWFTNFYQNSFNSKNRKSHKKGEICIIILLCLYNLKTKSYLSVHNCSRCGNHNE